MKRLLTLVAFFATLHASAQQVNPVPDYVFRNQMSVGRGTVTDTAAYFSIGPRYGATKGFMPPIVGDTATFSSGKRNGLLIFSVQKNKFLYWDSVRVQWSDMAGSSGAYIVAGDTSAMLAPYLRKVDTTSMLTAYLRKGDTSSMLGNYIRHAGYGLTKSGQSFLVDTLNIATRAWRQKGLDSLAALEVSGSGTTNYVPKFTAGSTIGNSQIFDNGTSVGINATSMAAPLSVFNSTANTAVVEIRGGGGSSQSRLSFTYGTTSATTAENGQIFGNTGEFSFRGGSNRALTFYTNPSTDTERLRITSGGAMYFKGASTTTDAQADIENDNTALYLFGSLSGSVNKEIRMYFNGTGSGERFRMFNNGRIYMGATPVDNGYQVDINGNLRSVNGANFATTSGNVGIGTASPNARLTVGTASGTLGIPTTATFYGTSTLSSSVGTVGIFSTESAAAGVGPVLTFGGQTGNAATPYPFAFIQGSKVDITAGNYAGQLDFFTVPADGGVPVRRLRISGDGELLINTTSDAGDYKLQVSGNIYNTGSAVLAATSGEVLIGTTTDRGAYKFQADGLSFFGSDANSYTLLNNTASNAAMQAYGAWTNHLRMTYPAVVDFDFQVTASGELDLKRSSTVATRVNTAREFMINTTTDAGDYHLQVVGNARIGTGKLDIASNTTFGIGVARSGTSEVAGQIYNSSGILYLGAESSAGGQIFTGSSAYAAVIGSGANYPLQFATNNITRATMTTSGNLLLGFTTDSYFLKLQVNGSIFSNNQVLAQGVNAQIAADSSANISPLYISNQSLTGSSAQGLFYGSTTWNTTGNPSLIDLNITNTASGATSNYIKISDGSNIFRVTKAAEVVTAAPTGGSIRKWKLGEAATVSPTSPNRTIRVEIDGVVYYLHAKTTND